MEKCCCKVQEPSTKHPKWKWSEMWNWLTFISLLVKMKTICLTTVSCDIKIPWLRCEVWGSEVWGNEVMVWTQIFKAQHPSILTFSVSKSHTAFSFPKSFAFIDFVLDSVKVKVDPLILWSQVKMPWGPLCHLIWNSSPFWSLVLLVVSFYNI